MIGNADIGNIVRQIGGRLGRLVAVAFAAFDL